MREIIKLISTGKTSKGKLTRYFRTTTKNKKIKPDKIRKMQYDPLAYNAETGKHGMHVMFEETKI